MRNSLTTGFVVIFIGCVLTSCPSGNNSVTLHNNHSYNIFQFSVTRLGPVDPADSEKSGINVLPEPLEPGESFTVDNLVDGNYQLWVQFYLNSLNPSSTRQVTQSLEGGKNYDWYFTGSKNANDEIEPGAPTAKAIVNELLGL